MTPADRAPAGVEYLAAAVVKLALVEEGVRWLESEGGQWWANVMGLEVEKLRAEAIKRGWEVGVGEDNRTVYRCERCGHWWRTRRTAQTGKKRCGVCWGYKVTEDVG